MSGYISSAVEQGDREYQQDRDFIKVAEGYSILAVMDGHGERGSEIAEFCKVAIGEILANEGYASDPEEVIGKIFTELLEKAPYQHDGGTTLSIAWIKEDKAVIGVLGDSPVLVVDKSGRWYKSPLHNTSNQAEKDAVLAKGGKVVTKNNCLYFHDPMHYGEYIQLSRAIGDKVFQDILLRVPAIYTVPNPKYVLVSSDGLRRAIAVTVKDDSTAEGLMEEARKYAGGLWDNTTVLLWKSA